jgi:myo-inositol 2-dehydrogenase / D-chiro-inositol 1-dehydrogenase
MAKLRIGFLGAGGMSRRHSGNLETLRGVEVVSFCDQCSKKDAAATSEQITGGRAVAYDDFDAMLNEQALDALYVCIPPGAHDGQVEKAARHGIHLFQEKPTAIDAKRAASQTRAIEKAGVIGAVGYMCRQGHAVRKLKGMIEDGSAGRPTLFTGRFFCNSEHNPWWRNVDVSGGQVLEQAIHTYDIAIHLLGQPEVATGFADNLCHTKMKDYTVEDTSVSAIRFANGAMASIVASNCAIPWEWTYDFRVVCEKVTVLFSSPNDAVFVYTEGGKARRRKVSKDVDILMAESKNFVAALKGKAEVAATSRDGLTGVKLTSAVLKSAAANGRPVRIR